MRVPLSSDADRAAARSALASLFEVSYDNVYRFCLARSGSESLAEEVAADTFADAARRFAAGDGGDVSMPWLITVARRRLIDRWRQNDRHRRRLEKLARQIPSSVPDPAVAGPDEMVLAALRSLPERQRVALTLRYLDEFSVDEVAEALRCSYPSAESLLARARRSFAKAYRETS